MLLGSELRKYREARGLTRGEAGHYIRGSESKISRMELGRVGFKVRDVEDLLKLYGVTDKDQVQTMVRLARESKKPGWWQEYGDSLPNWFQVYVGLEEAATRIRVYEAQFVPGMLQTEDYARAVISAGRSIPDPLLEDRVAVRMRRQRHIEDGGCRLWAIIDEAAVRRPVGGPDVMRGQLERLIELSDRRNITVQIVPFSAGAHAAEAGSFTILRYPDFGLSDIIYLEQLTGSMCLDRRTEIDAYTMAMEKLSVIAQPPTYTRDILKGMIDDLD
ncbi:helix-turn-helix domain-containing protein [Streptomonospora wellingtoniae]|uniref:Helix-turn-helix transcriptional regulator n=1 Tax=Streptomonospora wellingtoniae TaxID=3075544 RepID=A0ABU2KXS3_9ACTN|nr:helix-turn-helix transcriptional regulator [Streptomonospora sp. DSM 45055]MDT0304090.1 helix-turn-helix transcriptional regulator [Streptomonospora sp. DSM 45055]